MRRRHLLLATPALGQDPFPGNRLLTITVGYAAGGVGDMVMRQLAEAARSRRGAQAIIDIRPGAGGVLSLERLARAAPDGTQVALASPSAIFILPQQQQVGFDPLTLTALGQFSNHPLTVYVRGDSRFADWPAMVAFARANPGRLSWGTTGARGLADLIVTAAFRHLGAETSSIPFRGGSEAITALLGGHIDAVVSPDFGPLLTQGAVRLLAECGAEKVPGQPQVPTFRELGYPLVGAVTYGVVGPPGMPPAVVAWWQELIHDTAADPAFADLLRRVYATPAWLDAAAYGAAIRAGFTAFGAALRA